MQKNALSKQEASTLEVLKILSGGLRFRILVLLRAHHDGLTVGEIADILQGSVSRTSHQLRILKDANLIVSEGLDHQVRYRLNAERVGSLIDTLCSTYECP